MNWNTFIFASYEMLLSIVFGLFTVFITKKVLSKTFLKNEENPDSPYQNIAISIFSGMLILCNLLLVSTSISPAVDILNVLVMTGQPLTPGIFATSFVSFLLFYIIAIVMSISLIFLTTKVYMDATRNIDEMKELRNKNISVSLVMSIVLLGITISVRPPLQRFIFSMVNYEKHQIEAQGTLSEPEGDAEGVKEGEMVVPQKKVRPQ
jgi:hypothetical protein